MGDKAFEFSLLDLRKTTEVTAENFILFLEEDLNFVDFFNAFLSLPAFSQRLFYNTATQSFEEFDQHLADDIHSGEKKVIVEKNTIEERTRISYYVKFLTREEGFRWVTQNRLSSFLKSELYAEYKLSGYLAEAETRYLDILLHDAVVTDRKLQPSPALRSSRRLTLFPGLQAFHAQEGFDEPASVSIAKGNNSAVTKSYTPYQTSMDVGSPGSSTSEDTEELTEDKKHDICSKDSGNIFTFENSSLLSQSRNVPIRRSRSVDSFLSPSNEEMIQKSTGSVSGGQIRNRPSVCSVSNVRGNEPPLQRRATVCESKLELGMSHSELQALLERQKLITRRRTTLLSQFTEDSVDEDDLSNGESLAVRKVEDLKPLDLGLKAGIDAFKWFLAGTSGEKLFSLWISLERLCHMAEEESSSYIQKLRKVYLSQGHQSEVSRAIKTNLQRALSSVKIDGELASCQAHTLLPLLNYWCPRFLLHNKIHSVSHLCGYVNTDHHCVLSRCSYHTNRSISFPQRPNTCIPHVRILTEEAHSLQYSNPSRMLHKRCRDSVHLGKEGTTLKRMRLKSAHPRITTNVTVKETNAGYQQLLLLTTPPENGAGFRPPCRLSYHNDAAEKDLDYKRSIRLYLEPAPPPNSNCSRIKRVTESTSVTERIRDEESREQRLSLLAEALLLEEHSGEHFLEYLKERNKEHWLNCYLFWKDLRDYTACFFNDTFRQTDVQHKASTLYSTYIASRSPRDIGCSQDIQSKVYKALNPPYEDLFDDAEDVILNVLIQPWTEMLEEESQQFGKLNKEQKLKFIEVRRKATKPSLDDEEKTQEPETEEHDGEKISMKELKLPFPVPKDGVTFATILKDKVERLHFQSYLEGKDRKALNDFLAWMDIESFRRLPARASEEVRTEKAVSIRKKWLNEEYFFGPDSPATKEGQEEVLKLKEESSSMLPERPPTPLMLEAQRYIRARIERRWLLLYKETSGYINRRKSKTTVSDMVEDMMMKRRLQRSEAAWKILNSRWISGSRDVVSLRHTLLDPVKCNQFKSYLCLKGDLLENSVNFWLEVQRFKELCHCHHDNYTVSRKIQAIIEVFIKSSIPPELQIDVPIEIAERLYDKAAGRVPQHGPYLFREAQTTVFRILFSYWKDYVTFRASIQEDKVTQHLDELRKKHFAQRRAKKMAAERRRLAKISAEKRKKSKEEREKAKGKPWTEFANIFDEEEELETKTFSYSKHLVDFELQELEKRMRDNGFSLEDVTDLEASQSALQSKGGRSKKGSNSLNEENKSIKSTSVLSGSRSKLKISSLEKKMEKQMWTKEGTIQEATEDASYQSKPTVTVKPYRKKSRGTQDGESLISGKGHHDKAKSNGRLEGRMKAKMGNSCMPGPHRKSSDGEQLTMELLKKFERLSSGKSSKRTMPIIRVSQTPESSEKSPSMLSASRAQSRDKKPPRTKKSREVWRNEFANAVGPHCAGDQKLNVPVT